MPDVYVNGRLLDAAEARVSVFDRSYLFGEGVFESFRSHDGKIAFLKEHLQRLEWGATFLNLPFPSEVDFKEVCSELLERNHLKNARFKIVLSRNEEATGNEIADTVNVTVFCEPLPETSPTYRLKVVRGCVNDAPPIGAIKSTNRLAKVLGRQEAKEAGYDDGILLNAKGQVTEVTTGNLFWVDEKGRLNTVAESHGLLGGVTKAALIRLIREKNLAVNENTVTPEELSNAREVFMTNALVGIKPVTFIDRRQISGGETGPVTQMLLEAWQKLLEENAEKP